MSNSQQQIEDLKKFRTKHETAYRRCSIATEARFNRIREQFPDEGPFRRELYPQHMQFFAAGAEETERCFMAANRIGKTRAGACEMTEPDGQVSAVVGRAPVHSSDRGLGSRVDVRDHARYRAG
jgi:hypothetical protein